MQLHPTIVDVSAVNQWTQQEFAKGMQHLIERDDRKCAREVLLRMLATELLHFIRPAGNC
jgi:hypothetical protein